MENKSNETIELLNSLEKLELRVKSIEGLAHVCSVAFSTPGALSAVDEKDLESTFLSIQNSLNEVGNGLDEIVSAIYENRATIKYNIPDPETEYKQPF